MKKPTSLFIKAKVKDILWNGLFYDCTVKDFAGSAVCNELKLQYAEFGMVMVAENQYMHSLLGSVSDILNYFLYVYLYIV